MLEARDLWVTPPGGRDPVVRGVSLRAGRGEWVALAGPNGGGKTSLLLALAGLWPATRGALTLDGRPLAAEPRARDPRLAVVMQDPASQLLQNTVRDELAFTARNLGFAERATGAAVNRWAVTFGLEAELERDPLALSAGRQQLVLIAAALVADPMVLLADEPTAHLDATTRARVIAAIGERRRQGLTVVWATQDGGELEAADRVVTVGAVAAPAAGPPSRPPATDDRGPLLRVRIDATPPANGPAVALTEHMEFGIAAGVTALLGPNGAGKSALLAAVAGLIRSPQIAIQWESPPATPVSLALQYPELQIFEEVVADEAVFAATARGVHRAQALNSATAAFAALGLEPSSLLARRTWSLSTGEKRIVQAVSALVAPASLVLLDEPTAGLDAARRDALGDLVLRRAREIPVVVATQDGDWTTDLGAREIRLGTETRSGGSPSRKRD